MPWMPERMMRRFKKPRCFICNAKMIDDGAEVQYTYTDGGDRKLDSVVICLKCADSLDKKNIGSEYDKSI